LRHVQAIGQSAAEEALKSGGLPAALSHERGTEGGRMSGLMDLIPSLRGAPKKPELPRVVEIPIPRHDAAPGPEDQLPQFLRKESASRSAVAGAREEFHPGTGGPQVSGP